MSRGSELTKFIENHTLELRHQSPSLPGAVEPFCLLLLAHVATSTPSIPHSSSSLCPWAVDSTCTPLSCLPSASYLFITDSPKRLLSRQKADFMKRGEQADRGRTEDGRNRGRCQDDFRFACSHRTFTVDTFTEITASESEKEVFH